jgi:hypothetical protein
MLKGKSDKNFILRLPDELLSAEKPGAEGVAGVQGGGGGGGGGVPFPVVHGMVPTVPAYQKAAERSRVHVAYILFILKGLSRELDWAFDVINIFLPVNASSRWLNNVTCLFLSLLLITSV